MTRRRDLILQTTPREFNLAYHVENATRAVEAARANKRNLARLYAEQSRSWLTQYLKETGPFD